jgi:D-aminopeptidase
VPVVIAAGKEVIGEERYFMVSVEGIHTKDASDRHSFGAEAYLRKADTLEKIGMAVRGALDGTSST